MGPCSWTTSGNPRNLPKELDKSKRLPTAPEEQIDTSLLKPAQSREPKVLAVTPASEAPKEREVGCPENC